MLLGACGPIQYLANTPFEAAPALQEAKQAQGPKYAPYEMTASQEYLHKSRELAGYSRWQDSVSCARKATKFARAARNLAVEKSAMPEEKRDGVTGDTGKAKGRP